MVNNEITITEKSPDEMVALSDIGSLLLQKERVEFSPYLQYMLVAIDDYADNLVSFKKGEEKLIGGILAQRTIRVSKGKVVLKNEKKQKINNEIAKMVQDAVSKNALKSTQSFTNHDNDLDVIAEQETKKSKK